ncbi:hypothetical protein C2845_PM11G06750 [Panicum miliaceum]|uniref:Uncharacterized protein n=1 Tax=Panicum miliaceum TaxID=4540 RepID=A0A3L6RSW8_PANMI|nr:hypothetical protein C2845_PM11G06750 [Panicum miliaceum]
MPFVASKFAYAARCLTCRAQPSGLLKTGTDGRHHSTRRPLCCHVSFGCVKGEARTRRTVWGTSASSSTADHGLRGAPARGLHEDAPGSLLAMSGGGGRPPFKSARSLLLQICMQGRISLSRSARQALLPCWI